MKHALTMIALALAVVSAIVAAWCAKELASVQTAAEAANAQPANFFQ